MNFRNWVGLLPVNADSIHKADRGVARPQSVAAQASDACVRLPLRPLPFLRRIGFAGRQSNFTAIRTVAVMDKLTLVPVRLVDG